MEIELFIGIYVALCIGTGVFAFIFAKDGNDKALFAILVVFAIVSVVLFGIAAYMAPSWVSEALPESIIVN